MKQDFQFIGNSCSRMDGHKLKDIKHGRRIYRHCIYCGYEIAKYLRQIKWKNGLVQLVSR